MKAYKGFYTDMTCHGFQYEQGKSYEEKKAKLCKSGFHACLNPLECFRYYSPRYSEYHEVEVDDDADGISVINASDTKVSSKHIRIGAKLKISQIVDAAIEYIKGMSSKGKFSDTREDHGVSYVTEVGGASVALGDFGVSCVTGECGASSAKGFNGISCAAGYYAASSATGTCGISCAGGWDTISSASGYWGISSTTGYGGVSVVYGREGISSSAGEHMVSSAMGLRSVSTTSGLEGSSEAGNPTAIAIAWGVGGKAKGVIGSHLVLSEWDTEYTLKSTKMERVDGERIKANTWYTLVNGEFVEVKDEDL